MLEGCWIVEGIEKELGFEKILKRFRILASGKILEGFWCGVGRNLGSGKIEKALFEGFGKDFGRNIEGFWKDFENGFRKDL